MKIIAIELEGLWSFREHARIDIADIPMLIGVGENGAGKSAILVHSLDAALFGRFPGRVIADSITEGAKRGFVAVEFELAGTKYRVTRTHPRSGAASGVVFVEDDSLETGWRPITERGTKQTTECITELLGMSAEVAGMTWLSAQGQHSKFADATPAARFALLSTVFGLDDYVARAKAAHDKVKSFDQAITGVNGQITEQQDSMLLGDDVAEDADPIRTIDAAELEQRRAAAESEVVDIVVEIAALVALVLLVLTLGLALLLPHIPGLAKAATRMPETLEVVDRAPDTLDQVQRIDRNVKKVTPPVVRATKDLSLVAPHIETLAGQVDRLLRDLETLQRTSKPLGEAAPKLARLSGQLGDLQTSLRRLDGRLASLDQSLVEPLDKMERPLRSLASTTGPLPGSLDRLNRSTAVLEELPGYFENLQRTLRRVERHVRNLDEKTGPNIR